MPVFLDRMSEKLSNDKFAAAILIAASFFVYANALVNDFVWDDEEQVVNNTIIRDWHNFPIIFTSSTFYAGGAGLSGGFYRPLVTLSYFFNYWVWGLQPFGYHLLQLIFHCANAVLIFYLLDKIFGSQNLPRARLLAFVVALVFAVHPANVESVSYAGSIGEVVYVFFSLLALLVFAGSFKEGRLAGKKSFLISFLMVFLGLMAKESAIVVLPLMLAYFLLFTGPAKETYLKFAAGTAITLASYAFLRLSVAKIAPVSQFLAPIHLAPLWQRLLTVPYEIVSYLGIILFPKDLSVSRHFVVASAADPRFWGSSIALLALGSAAAFYVFKTRSKVFAFFVLWFAIALAPALNIIPLDMTMAERWLYFPLIGALGALTALAAGALEKGSPRKREIAAMLLAGAVIALGTRTIIRNGDWRNGLSLYSRDIALAQRISPQGSFDLENNYGVELFRAQRFDEAEDHFKRSVALQPNWATSQNNLGAALERDGDLDGALGQYEKAAGKNYYLACENAASILIKTRRYEEAKKFLGDSLVKFPGNAKLQFDLALIYAADNVGNDKNAKQKAIYLLSLILQNDAQDPQARQLLWMLRNGQKIEL